MESNYKKHASVCTMLSTKLKFDTCIVDHCSSYYINFNVSRIHSVFTGYTKYHTLCPIGSNYLFHYSIVNLLNLYKIYIWYVFFIMYCYHWK